MEGAAASAYQPSSAFQKDVLFAFGGGDPRVTIAVLDGPVDRTHECFRGARLTPLEAVTRMREPEGRALASGSHTASVIFGQPCSSVEGIAPLCRGLLIPIFDDSGAGCSPRLLARAIFIAIEHGAQVIHVSSGRFDDTDECDPVLAEALAMCRRRGVLIVVAADRATCGHLIDSSAYFPLLAVQSWGGEMLRQTRGKAVARLPQDAVVLPGAHVVGAALEGGVARRSGATCAAALLTGLVGLMLSRQLRDGRRADPLAVRDALLRDGLGSEAGTRPSVFLTRSDIARVVDRFGFRRPRTARFPFDLTV